MYKWKWSRSVVSDFLRSVNCSPPSSSIHRILQAKILEWVVISFSKFMYAAKSLQSCLILRDPINGSPPGSPVPGILQARTLEWVAVAFSNACKWKVKVKLLSRVRVLATPWTAAHQAPPSMGFSRQEYWSGVPLPSPNLCIGWHKMVNVGGNIAVLNGVGRKSFLWKVSFEQRPERGEEVRHVKDWWRRASR